MSNAPKILRVVDMHTAGEPVRIFEEGYPELQGSTIIEKRRDALNNHDHLRRALMLEPRGHAGMYGAIPTGASSPDAHFGVLFTHQEGYSTMCGHATIALGRWAADTGRVSLNQGRGSFKLEVPCGVIDVHVEKNGDATNVSFVSVDSFASHIGQSLDVPGLGEVRFDIAFGGAFYAILPASSIGLSLIDSPLQTLVDAGVAITDAVRRSIPIVHPTEPDLSFLYGTILTDDVPLGAATDETSYNLCIFAEGQIDRSPTGSGVTARIALAGAKKEMQIGQSCRISGVSGKSFTGTLASMRQQGEVCLVNVDVAGTAYYSGRTEFIFEEADPFAFGFELPATFSEVL